MTDTSLLFVFATPISSVTGAWEETRQSITSPLPLSSSSSLDLLLFYFFITLCPSPLPFYNSSFIIFSSSFCHFSPIRTSSGFSLSPHNTSSLPPYPSPPSVSLQHAYSQGEKKRGTCHSDREASSCFPLREISARQSTDVTPTAKGSSKPRQSPNKCRTVLCGIPPTVSLLTG